MLLSFSSIRGTELWIDSGTEPSLAATAARSLMLRNVAKQGCRVYSDEVQLLGADGSPTRLTGCCRPGQSVVSVVSGSATSVGSSVCLSSATGDFFLEGFLGHAAFHLRCRNVSGLSTPPLGDNP